MAAAGLVAHRIDTFVEGDGRSNTSSGNEVFAMLGGSGFDVALSDTSSIDMAFNSMAITGAESTETASIETDTTDMTLNQPPPAIAVEVADVAVIPEEEPPAAAGAAEAAAPAMPRPRYDHVEARYNRYESDSFRYQQRLADGTARRRAANAKMLKNAAYRVGRAPPTDPRSPRSPRVRRHHEDVEQI